MWTYVAYEIGIGHWGVIDKRYYRLILIAPLHVRLRFVDVIPLYLSTERTLFRRRPFEAYNYVASILPTEGEKYKKEDKKKSLKKTIKVGLNGNKAKLILSNSHPFRIIEIVSKQITGDSALDKYHRFVCAAFVFLFEVGLRMMSIMMSDVPKTEPIDSPYWDKLFRWALSTFNKIRNEISWLLKKPTILQLLLVVPHVLYNIAFFNVTFDREYTMEDFVDQVMEKVNLDFKVNTRHFNARNQESFESQFDSLYMQMIGGLEYATYSFHLGLQNNTASEYITECDFNEFDFHHEIESIVIAFRENKPMPSCVDKQFNVAKFTTIQSILTQHIKDTEKKEEELEELRNGMISDDDDDESIEANANEQNKNKRKRKRDNSNSNENKENKPPKKKHKKNQKRP
eukprot:956979_1